jgi:hypothetical protein
VGGESAAADFAARFGGGGPRLAAVLAMATDDLEMVRARVLEAVRQEAFGLTAGADSSRR